MRVLVVINPQATATTERERDVVIQALRSVADIQVAETANRGHAAALACRAMRDGTEVVVALGGDGTVNEVVNGLLTDGQHPDVPALGIVPAGSTNVFARVLGLPNDLIDATGVLLEGLRQGRRRPVSLGQMDDRWFVFAGGIGFGAAVVAEVERQRIRGKRATNGLYARSGLRTYLQADRRHPRLHVDLPDGTTLDGIHFAIFTNTDPWTYFANRPLHLTPQAGFDRGLSLYARRRMSAAGLVLGLVRMSGDSPRIGRLGAYLRDDLPGFTVRADEPLLVEVDGDLVGLRDKLVLRSAAAAMTVVV